MPQRVAAARRTLALAASYAVPTLLLGWMLGGQALFGRVDAMLALPLLTPGALLFAWLTRGDGVLLATKRAGAALLLLFLAQIALHFGLAGRVGAGQAFAVGVGGVVCIALSMGIVRRTAAWRSWVRGLCFVSTVVLGFVAGQGALSWWYRDLGGGARQAVMMTGLPLRWSGGAGDIADMLAAGPADAPALAALEAAVPLRLVDTLADLAPTDRLLLAHPRALSPRDLVRIDSHVRSGGAAIILADALSSWHPPHPLGDPRNPPVTSLLTPLLDHWGIELAAPDAGVRGETDIVINPEGWRLRLHSAGRFVRFPRQCHPYGDARMLRCRIGDGAVWIVGDADMLDADLWQSPVAAAPWLRRSDNIAWLVQKLRGAQGNREPAPLWIRARRP
jgi:hypothetical protein